MMPVRSLFLSALGVFVLVVALYLPTLRGGFVYDSFAQILYSDYIHTPSNWTDVLTLRVVGQDELDRNRPLHLASLMLDAALWGREPFGYRFTSVLLHAMNAALLFVFVIVARRRELKVSAAYPSVLAVAGFGALFFALHPLVVEAVAEPSNREDLLVLCPVLVGLLSIVLLSWKLPVASNALLIVCSFLAVTAKESGAAAPLIFAAAAWFLVRPQLRKLMPGIVVSALIVVLFLSASYVWRPQDSAIFSSPPRPLADDFWMSVGVQLRIWTLQLRQILWPSNLSADYPAQVLGAVALPWAIGAIGVVALMVIGVFRRGGMAALGVAVFILALLPASNFVPQYHPIGDRYLYVPLAGLGMLVAALLARLQSKYSSGFAGAAVSVVCFVLLAAEYAANVRRQLVWQHPASLWSDVAQQFPEAAVARLGLANAHFRAGDFEAARAAAADAVLFSKGRWDDTWAMRAICEWKAGHQEQAIMTFRQLVELSPGYVDWEKVRRSLRWSPEQLAVLKSIAASASR